MPVAGTLNQSIVNQSVAALVVGRLRYRLCGLRRVLSMDKKIEEQNLLKKVVVTDVDKQQ